MTKRRDFGNVRQLTSGRWQVRYPAPDGTQRLGPRTFRTRKEAADFLSTVRAQMLDRRWTDPARRIPTLDEYLPRFQMTRKGRSGAQIRATTLALSEDQYDKYLRPSIGRLRLDQFDEEIVADWYDSLPNRPAQRRQLYSLLKAMLNSAVRRKIIRSNPCQVPEAGKQPPSGRRVFRYPDCVRVWAQLPDDLRALAQIAFYAHLRLGEVLALRWMDVDLDSGLVQVHQTVSEVHNEQVVTGTKTGIARQVQLSPNGRAILREYAETRTGPQGVYTLPEGRGVSDHIFTRPDGGVLRHFHVGGAWKRARVAASLADLRFHDLRHVGLTMLAEDKMSLDYIMKRAGHTTYAAALVYMHRAAAQDENDAAALDRVIDRTPTRGLRAVPPEDPEERLVGGAA